MKAIIAASLIVIAACGHGQSGAALFFDGSNDYVALPNNNNVFNISAAHIKTVQFWFRNTAGQGSVVRIFSTGSATWTTGMWIGYGASSNSLRFEVSDGAGNGVGANGFSNIRGDNTYHHAAVAMSGSLASLYLDGVLEATLNISSEGAIASAGSVHIGNSYNNEPNSYFEGNVDELRVWDRGLCGAEIAATKNCELGGNEPGLVAYYRFNQGVANGNNSGVTTLTDATSNANHGTLNNFALSTAVSNWYSPGGVTTGSACPAYSYPSMSVLGNSVLISNGDYTPAVNDNTEFGAVCPGAILTKTFSIMNAGTGVLNISGITTSTNSSGVFSVSPLTHTISSSTSAVFTVAFSPTVSGYVAGLVSINGNDCSNLPYSFAISATVLPAPSPTPAAGNVCQGQALGLQAPAASSYSWAGPSSFGSSVQNPVIQNALPSHSGTYSLAVTYSNGCTAAGTVSVTVYPVTIPVVMSATACAGSTASLSAFGNGSFTWFGPGSYSSATQNLVFQNAGVGVSGIYTVVSLSAGNCTAAAQGTLQVYPLPSLTVAGSTVCSGETVTVTASGATGYIWSGPNGLFATFQNVYIANAGTVSAGIYTLNAYNTPGCAVVAHATVVVNPTPTIAVTPVVQACAMALVNIVPAGGTTYFWQGPNSYTSSGQSLSLTASSAVAGVYTLTAFHPQGCQASTQLTLDVITFTFGIVTSNPLLCAGEAATLSVIPAVNATFSWNPPAAGTGTSVVVAPSAPATYTVSGQHVAGCSTTNTFVQQVAACTAFNDGLPLDVISIYPNPFAERLTVCTGKKIISARIYSGSGQLVYEGHAVTGNLIIDLPGIPGGLYLIEVQAEAKRLTRRIVRE